MKYYRIHHLQRSGGHVFCDWLATMMPAATTWVNNALQLGAQHTIGTLKGSERVILNIEDANVRYAQQMTEVARALHWGWPEGHWTDIVLIRNPYHLFASRYHFDQECIMGNTTPEAIELWESHAAYFDDPRGTLPIQYERIVTDQSYQERIAAKLGLSWRPWPNRPPRIGVEPSHPGSPLTRAQDAPHIARILPSSTKQLAEELL